MPRAAKLLHATLPPTPTPRLTYKQVLCDLRRADHLCARGKWLALPELPTICSRHLAPTVISPCHHTMHACIHACGDLPQRRSKGGSSRESAGASTTASTWADMCMHHAPCRIAIVRLRRIRHDRLPRAVVPRLPSPYVCAIPRGYPFIGDGALVQRRPQVQSGFHRQVTSCT